MLNCLTGAIPARERVITCEEVFELADPSSHWTRTVTGIGSPVAADVVGAFKGSGSRDARTPG